MNVEEYLKKQAELEQALAAGSKDMLKEFFQGFFEQFPDLTGVRWAQYAPYFSDGEPCIFSVNEPEFSATEGVSVSTYTYGYPEDSEDEDGAADWFTPESVYTAKRRLGDQSVQDKALSEWTKKFNTMEPVLHAITDDGQITVLKTDDGVNVVVDEFEHD